MRYHIATGLIVEKFKENDGCPLCAIEKKVESGILNEFLADACMDDAVRTKVNKYGFCADHYDALFALPSKLGLSLQTDTRMNTIRACLAPVEKAGAAKKRALDIERKLSSCLICDIIREEMVKYYKTIAQMYASEAEFHELLSSSSFCLKHFAKLLAYSDYASLKAKDYLRALYKTQLESFDKTQDNLKAFSAHHDYRKINTPMGEEKNALKDARSLLYGKK